MYIFWVHFLIRVRELGHFFNQVDSNDKTKGHRCKPAEPGYFVKKSGQIAQELCHFRDVKNASLKLEIRKFHETF